MKKTYALVDLDCANCARKMEDGIKKLEGVADASVSFLTQRMTIEFADGADVDTVMNLVKDVCRRVEPDCRIRM